MLINGGSTKLNFPRHFTITGPIDDPNGEYKVYLTINTGDNLRIGAITRAVIIVSVEGTTIFNNVQEPLGVEIRTDDTTKLMEFQDGGAFLLYGTPREAAICLYNLTRHMLGSNVTSNYTYTGFDDVTIEMPNQKIMVRQDMKLTWTGEQNEDFMKIIACLERFTAAEVMR